MGLLFVMAFGLLFGDLVLGEPEEKMIQKTEEKPPNFDKVLEGCKPLPNAMEVDKSQQVTVTVKPGKEDLNEPVLFDRFLFRAYLGKGDAGSKVTCYLYSGTFIVATVNFEYKTSKKNRGKTVKILHKCSNLISWKVDYIKNDENGKELEVKVTGQTQVGDFGHQEFVYCE